MDHIGVGHKTKNTVKHIYRSDYNLMKSYLDLMKLIIVKTGIGLLPSHSLMKYYIGHIGINIRGGGVQSDSKTVRSLMKSCLYFMKLGFY